MLLDKRTIREMGLVVDAVDAQFRDVGYDLTVGKIIDPNGNEHAKQFGVPPSGIVEVISKERLNLPTDICGFAHIKTSMVQQGLLPLNMGIVDPGWHGRLSATLVNFGDNQDRLVQIGDPFLRLTFVKYVTRDTVSVPPYDEGDYLRTRVRKVREYFGDTFLGIDTVKKHIGSDVDSKLQRLESRLAPNRIALWTAALAAGLIAVQLAGSYIIATDIFGLNRPSLTESSQTYLSAAETAAQAADNAEQSADSALRMINELRAQLQTQAGTITHLTMEIEKLQSQRDSSQ